MSEDTLGGGRRQTRILIVPDDLLTWEVRESYLDRNTFVVRTAHHADEALAISKVWNPALVFFRSELEGMPVTRFCAELRAAAGDNPIKLLMFTDQVGAPLDDAVEAAPDAHLISPIEPDQLLDTIASLMTVPRRRSPRASIDVLVETDAFPGADSGLANSINVSEDGMLIEANGHLPINEPGVLRFFLPGSPKRMTIKAVVRVSVDEIRLHYALEFIDLAPGHRALIRQYISQAGGAR